MSTKEKTSLLFKNIINIHSPPLPLPPPSTKKIKTYFDETNTYSHRIHNFVHFDYHLQLNYITDYM